MPSRIGRFDIVARVGEGGMATLYAARPREGPLLSREVVALKVIRDEFGQSPDFMTMFVDEARIAARFRHPGIVEVFELGLGGRPPFLAMELLLGQSLWQVWQGCRRHGVKLRFDMVARIGVRIADALAYAHQCRDEYGRALSIVHRDINPSNIFITFDGRVKVIDFGLAKAANRISKTAAGVIKGKVSYMSPEQARGTGVDHRTDIFALGVTLWELAVDRRLFKADDDIETLRRVDSANVPDPTLLVAGFPRELWAVLRKALSRDPRERYQSASDMARDLEGSARAEGRLVSEADIVEVMQSLFVEEHRRQLAWLERVSVVEQTARLPTMKPPQHFDGPLARLDKTLPLMAVLPSGLISTRHERIDSLRPSAPPTVDPNARAATTDPPRGARRRTKNNRVMYVIVAVVVAALLGVALALMVSRWLLPR